MTSFFSDPFGFKRRRLEREAAKTLRRRVHKLRLDQAERTVALSRQPRTGPSMASAPSRSASAPPAADTSSTDLLNPANPLSPLWYGHSSSPQASEPCTPSHNHHSHHDSGSSSSSSYDSGGGSSSSDSGSSSSGSCD